MSAPSFAQLVHEMRLRRRIVAEYQAAIADVMLARIAAFGADPAFQDLAHELANMLDIHPDDAAAELLEVSTSIYRAATHAVVVDQREAA